MKRYAMPVLFLAAVAGGAVAYAHDGSVNDAMAIRQAKISLTDAVTAAEQQVNGKATRAEFEHSKQGWMYEVEVVSDTKVYDVRVSADNGTVISAQEDEEDREHERKEH
jgi:uncharacterized membrane protein YkoI